MKSLLIFVISVMVVITAACSGVIVTGSGEIVTQEMDFTGFDKLDISQGFNVEVNEGDEFSVVIRADDNIVEYLQVEIPRQPAAVDNQYQAPQRLAGSKKFIEQPSPVSAQGPPDTGESIARQIYDAPVFLEAEKIDQLRPARALARAGEIPAVQDGIDRTGFAGIRTPGKSDLRTFVRHELACLVRTGQKCGTREYGHTEAPSENSCKMRRCNEFSMTFRTYPEGSSAAESLRKRS